MEKKKIILAASAGIALGALAYGLYQRRREIAALIKELRPVTKKEVRKKVQELSENRRKVPADKATVRKIVGLLFVEKEKFLRQRAVPHQMKKNFLVGLAMDKLSEE